MELTPGQRDALTVALHDVRGDVRERVLTYAMTVWDGLGDWRDDDIARFVAAVAPQVEAGKLTIARATDAYMAALLDDDPAGVADLSQIRGGIPSSEVYRRPAVSMRTELAGGSSFTDALDAGRRRLQSLVSTDLQLAHTHQARHSMTVPGSRRRRRRDRGEVEAFRRVPTGRENCALCLIASTQRYWVRDLMPIHPGCDCGAEPLGAGQHTDQVIDADLLEAVHAQVEGLVGVADRSGREVDYRQLIVTREHGEIGPIIGWRGQKFTTAAEIAHEVITVAPKPEPTASWVWETIESDDLSEWGRDDLIDLYNEALALDDERSMDALTAWLNGTERQTGYRGTGRTREELRQEYAEHVDRERWAAEDWTRGTLLNAAGRAAGIDPKSLFTGTETRAYKYASDELKYYWQEHPRQSFDMFIGDAEARGRSGKAEF